MDRQIQKPNKSITKNPKRHYRTGKVISVKDTQGRRLRLIKNSSKQTLIHGRKYAHRTLSFTG